MSSSSLSSEYKLATDALCMVCEARAQGYYSGVLTCKTCQNFFDCHSVKKTFICEKNQNCGVRAAIPTYCQRCRLRKCLDVGMTKIVSEGKLYGSAQFESIPELLFEEIVKKLAASYANSSINHNIQKTTSILQLSISENALINRINAWRIVAPFMENELKRTVNLMAQMPGLHRFGEEDKVTLLKKNVFLVFFLRNLKNFDIHGYPLPSFIIPFYILSTLFGCSFDKISVFIHCVKLLQLDDKQIAVFTGFAFFHLFSVADRKQNQFQDHNNLVLINKVYRTVLLKLLSKQRKNLRTFLNALTVKSTLRQLFFEKTRKVFGISTTPP
ncbi:hypothetical protein CRE_24203 [Caenorhabditis remanei]|uniref:Uncharacterized protein n=1 Tax=Caenorhabditis remanei TaxID=31234 RepID=E3NCW1_CAERE|nr:hypothetical protein CRE_24203 [Caenorhabditis remanei]